MVSGVSHYRWLSAAAVALGLGVLPAHAHAQAAATAAEVLFEEGRRLMSVGDYPAACGKLAESQRLDPAGGTLMNLAACHERWGKVATAWAEFNDALAQARRERRVDRVQEATARIAELEPRLPRVKVEIAAREPGLVVLLDGAPLGAPSWGTAIPLDPGAHELRALAPERLPWSARVSVDEGQARAVSVPPLSPARPVVPAPPPAEPPRQAVTYPLRPAGLVVGASGLAAVGVGAGFGALAIVKKDESKSQCSASGTACSAPGAALVHDANTAAWVSDIAIFTGVAALVAAAYLVFAPARSGTTAARFVLGPSIGTAGFGASAGGAF